jgi:hypothetical protein
MKGLGSIAFIVGLVLAAIIAIFSSASVPVWAIIVMAILGLIVGLLNIGDKEVMLFLVAAITFLISFQALSSVFTIITFGWAGVSTFFSLMNVFIAPAASVVAFIALVKLIKD